MEYVSAQLCAHAQGRGERVATKFIAMYVHLVRLGNQCFKIYCVGLKIGLTIYTEMN